MEFYKFYLPFLYACEWKKKNKWFLLKKENVAMYHVLLYITDPLARYVTRARTKQTTCDITVAKLQEQLCYGEEVSDGSAIASDGY